MDCSNIPLWNKLLFYMLVICILKDRMDIEYDPQNWQFSHNETAISRQRNEAPIYYLVNIIHKIFKNIKEKKWKIKKFPWFLLIFH